MYPNFGQIQAIVDLFLYITKTSFCLPEFTFVAILNSSILFLICRNKMGIKLPKEMNTVMLNYAEVVHISVREL
jgi:hypothetical protein